MTAPVRSRAPADALAGAQILQDRLVGPKWIRTGVRSYHVILNLIQDPPAPTDWVPDQVRHDVAATHIRAPWAPDQVRRDVAANHVRAPWAPDQVRRDVLGVLRPVVPENSELMHTVKGACGGLRSTGLAPKASSL